MSFFIVAVVLLVLFGGVGYGYQNNGSYPFRGSAPYGIGGLLVVLLLLWAFHII